MVSRRPKETEHPVFPLVEAMRWTQRITGVSCEMVAPILIGWFADDRLGTLPWFTVVGAGAGLALSMRSLLLIAKQQRELQRSDDSESSEKEDSEKNA
ncbi:MAG: AtpZ/AtpI family protein [Thermoguttaceae bacterium]|nr:AtpZ/AtpI family protein [Thermoguttaceae bacterium]